MKTTYSITETEVHIILVIFNKENNFTSTTNKQNNSDEISMPNDILIKLLFRVVNELKDKKLFENKILDQIKDDLNILIKTDRDSFFNKVITKNFGYVPGLHLIGELKREIRDEITSLTYGLEYLENLDSELDINILKEECFQHIMVRTGRWINTTLARIVINRTLDRL
jgi:hypothetical protein